MYVIEKLIRLYKKYIIKEKPIYIQTSGTDEEELEDIVTCKHTFMPVDSTGNLLACSKCGYLITRKRLNKIRCPSKKLR